MGERSQIIQKLPKKMYSIESYMKAYPYETIKDAEDYISEQKSTIHNVWKEIREEYNTDELTDNEITLLIEYQVRKSLKYSPDARDIDPKEDAIFILDEIEKDSNYFHNVLAIGELLKFNNINDKISFAIKYSKCKIWNELLQLLKNNEIDESLIDKLNIINSVNSRIKGDIGLQEIINWDGNISSLEFDTSFDINELSGHATPVKNSEVIFHKYCEEVISIKEDGNIYYSSVEGKGHPQVVNEIYKDDFEITEDMKMINGVKTCVEAAKKHNITIFSAGADSIIFLPEMLSEEQKKSLFKLMNNCDLDLFKFIPAFILNDESSKGTEFDDENGVLSTKDAIIGFIDKYLGRHDIKDIEYEEYDLHLEKNNKQQENNTDDEKNNSKNDSDLVIGI